MIKVTLKAKQKVTRRDVSNLHYARDIVIVAKKQSIVLQKFTHRPKKCEEFQVKVNPKRNKKHRQYYDYSAKNSDRRVMQAN